MVIVQLLVFRHNTFKKDGKQTGLIEKEATHNRRWETTISTFKDKLFEFINVSSTLKGVSHLSLLSHKE